MQGRRGGSNKETKREREEREMKKGGGKGGRVKCKMTERGDEVENEKEDRRRQGPPHVVSLRCFHIYYILEGKQEGKWETEKAKPLVYTNISPQYIVSLSEPYGVNVERGV